MNAAADTPEATRIRRLLVEISSLKEQRRDLARQLAACKADNRALLVRLARYER